jgi:hypothetical protein
MDLFKNRYDSHDHSLRILDLVYCYDSFMDSVTTVCDMGCGAGMDIKWWAECESRDDPPIKRNYICYGVDKDGSVVDGAMLPPNVTVLVDNFETVITPRKIDIMWSHDSFQYAMNPLQTLQNWNKNMNTNGMLVLSLPQLTGYFNNRLVTRSYNHVFYNHNVLTMLYMLGVTGFDAKDLYVYKVKGDPWINIVTYKTGEIMESPDKVTWYDLIEKDMVHESIVKSMTKFNYIRQEDLIFSWVDQNFYLVED